MSAPWTTGLSVAERRELIRKLTRAYHRFGAASNVTRRTGEGELSMSLTLAAGEMAVLYTDITERAQDGTS